MLCVSTVCSGRSETITQTQSFPVSKMSNGPVVLPLSNTYVKARLCFFMKREKI